MLYLTLIVPDSERQKYIDLIFENRNVFSKGKNDLGRANNFTLKIDLKDKAPVYIPQYHLPDAHKVKLEEQVEDGLKWVSYNLQIQNTTAPFLLYPKRKAKIVMY